MAIIKNIEQLKLTIKINQNTPMDTLEIYLQDAQDKYLVYYLGVPIVEILESIDEKNTSDENKLFLALLPKARRVLGPFAEAMGTHERSINTGDSGHTVVRTDKLAPASDEKIEKAVKSLLSRAWQNLENLLEYVDTNIAEYPTWKESKFYKNSKSYFFKSAVEFQDFGLIDIEQSRLTFEKIRQLIIRIELSEVKRLLTDELYDNLLTEVELDEKKEHLRIKMLRNVQAYIGARVGELHTSQTTHSQRAQDGRGVLEYQPLIRPIYEDLIASGNYYSEQSAFWEAAIMALLPDFGIDISGGKMEWNNQDRRIFNAEG